MRSTFEQSILKFKMADKKSIYLIQKKLFAQFDSREKETITFTISRKFDLLKSGDRYV